MKRLALLLTFVPALLFSACNNDVIAPRVRGVGPTESQTRTVNNFTELDLKIDADVYLTQGPQQEVRIEAQRNILDVLETEITGNKLEIEYGHYNVRSHSPIKIYITVPTLSEANVSGSGKVRSSTAWTAPSLKLDVAGSGKIDMQLQQVEGLRSHISGSGKISLRGAAQSHTSSISGSGDVDAFDLITQDTYVSISGSGKNHLYASRTLTADISGSGSVYYRGNPTVNSRISGSGKVLSSN
ncbi:head GIN domain-containing protein [Hymenobacter jejuensis]|uniref:DUF2807 domain-containing protein n=1 Tax=Hymenobacter jejuensis TaxID=2502781 RepID=A0A5B7ZXH9_9BACT|nr:head GIN domain-containing protein [Hymenobacter jejuensis]QDA59688.1 DUF2807 domain-containing protein [Hymenobacter jejuensis]